MQVVQLFLQHRIDQVDPHHRAGVRVSDVVRATREGGEDVERVITQLRRRHRKERHIRSAANQVLDGVKSLK